MPRTRWCSRSCAPARISARTRSTERERRIPMAAALPIDRAPGADPDQLLIRATLRMNAIIFGVILGLMSGALLLALGIAAGVPALAPTRLPVILMGVFL